MTKSDEIRGSVSFFLLEFETLAAQFRTNVQASMSKSKPPPTDDYKINVDASFHASTNQAGWGFVARDWEG